MPFKVLIDDNFHYMDASHRSEHGVFATCEDAVAACKGIIDRELVSMYRPGMSADELFLTYAQYGEDPFVVGEEARPSFSARDYARQQCSMIVPPGR